MDSRLMTHFRHDPATNTRVLVRDDHEIPELGRRALADLGRAPGGQVKTAQVERECQPLEAGSALTAVGALADGGSPSLNTSKRSA